MNATTSTSRVVGSGATEHGGTRAAGSAPTSCPHCSGPLTFRRMDFDLYRPHVACLVCMVAWDTEDRP